MRLFFLFIIASCSATQHFNLKSNKPARIEVNGAVICNSTPCLFSRSCMSSSQRTYFTAYPLKKAKKSSYEKAVKAPCDIGGRNTVDVLFDLNSNDDGRGQVLSELQLEREDLSADAAFVNSMSKAGQQIGEAFNQPDNSVPTNYGGTPSYGCGIKPIPKPGCQVGRCINGVWEQVCSNNSGVVCGVKPIPNIGCQIGRCVNGAWEQVCSNNSGVVCGIKPIPNIGCRLGRCVDGAWEQVCN